MPNHIPYNKYRHLTWHELDNYGCAWTRELEMTCFETMAVFLPSFENAFISNFLFGYQTEQRELSMTFVFRLQFLWDISINRI